jgi:uncharacterized protein DUF3187
VNVRPFAPAGAALLLALALGPPSAVAADDEAGAVSGARRGPLESREEFLLAQPRLTLPSVSPDPLQAGETRVRLDGDWGSDFGSSRVNTGQVSDLRFLVDGEHRSLALDVRHGFRPSLTLGVRVPVHWRGPGVLDGLIDAWHDLIGLPDNDRRAFPTGQLRVDGRDERYRPVHWTGGAGSGLGNLELSAQWALPGSQDGGWAVSTIGRVALPTGTGPFATGGVDAGAQVVAARGLFSGWDLYLGAGGTVFGDTRAQGLRYERFRAHGFAVVEWRAARRLSLLVEASAASRLVTSFADYPGLQLYLRGAAKLDVGRLRLEAGFVEGLKSLQTTTDFGVMLSVSRSF